MKFSTEINIQTNYIASLEVISDVFPEIKNTGYKNDMENIISNEEIKKYEIFNTKDVQKAYFLNGGRMLSESFQPTSAYSAYFSKIKNNLETYKLEIEKNLTVIKTLSTKLNLNSTEIKLSIVDSPNIGYNIGRDEIVISPRMKDVPFCIICLNGTIYLELYKHLNLAIVHGVSVNRFSEIANYIIVEKHLWIEAINQSFNYQGPKVTTSPNFTISEIEKKFIESIGFSK